ncbi:DUF4135 domain-containing protein [Candidatus Neptunichlamydia sp. REUL1]|uniref:DUF4135 domain-containing protein n=1 Tax=Candidatus Neptunichlamydia sp. REUL1 TaxID=3064277 RepID=UPI00292ECAB0|nr:DUF4135 domain-containing protein [Candidatus Neptunochlamydia sp. REUL1]
MAEASSGPTGSQPVSGAQSSDNQSHIERILEAIASPTLRVSTKRPQGDSLFPSFFEEVKGHIKQDCSEIVRTFFPECLGLEVLSKIKMEIAGDETHFGGKKSLFLTFTVADKEIRLVYKPRSLIPDQILENVLHEVCQKELRPMLDCGDHGYDSRLQGIEIPVSKFTSEMRNKVNQAHMSTVDLVTVLHHMGFEDTHNENFILDGHGNLHFIDPEIFCTKIAVDMEGIYKGVKGLLKRDTSFQERVDSITSACVAAKKELMENCPTRVIFCDTATYITGTPNPILGDPKIKIGKTVLATENIPNGFDGLHKAYLGKFLAENGFIKVPKKNQSFDVIVATIKAAFQEDDALEKIKEEVDKSFELRKEMGCANEVPAFRFHLKAQYIQCPLTKQCLLLRKPEERGES